MTRDNFQENMDTKVIPISNGVTVEEDVKMADNDFVSQKELDQLEDKIDLKITTAIQPIEGKIDNLETNIDGKFNTLEARIETMLLKQKEEISKDRKENIKWIVGTAIALVGAVLAIYSQFG